MPMGAVGMARFQARSASTGYRPECAGRSGILADQEDVDGALLRDHRGTGDSRRRRRVRCNAVEKRVRHECHGKKAARANRGKAHARARALKLDGSLTHHSFAVRSHASLPEFPAGTRALVPDGVREPAFIEYSGTVLGEGDDTSGTTSSFRARARAWALPRFDLAAFLPWHSCRGASACAPARTHLENPQGQRPCEAQYGLSVTKPALQVRRVRGAGRSARHELVDSRIGKRRA